MAAECGVPKCLLKITKKKAKTENRRRPRHSESEPTNGGATIFAEEDQEKH